MRRTKAALTLAGTALVLGSLVGCGSGDGESGGSASAPEDASLEDFCESFNGLVTDMMKGATEGEVDGTAQAIKQWAEDLAEVGTPEEMPDDVREGFEIFIEQASKIDDDATLDDLQNLDQDISEADADKATEFSGWTVSKCPSALPDGLGDLPTDLPTELPSDLASELEDLPTELPSDLASQLDDLPTDPDELESMLAELEASLGS